MPLGDLSFGTLVFPAVWDWYVQWRERRRGFYTAWEVDMLSVAVALSAAPTGWMAQMPRLAERLKPLAGLISTEDVADPGTFFVKTVKASSAEAAYNQTTFYEAWRLTIQRYGVFKPYTGAAPSRTSCRTGRTMCATCWLPTS